MKKSITYRDVLTNSKEFQTEKNRSQIEKKREIKELRVKYQLPYDILVQIDEFIEYDRIFGIRPKTLEDYKEIQRLVKSKISGFLSERRETCKHKVCFLKTNNHPRYYPGEGDIFYRFCKNCEIYLEPATDDELEQFRNYVNNLTYTQEDQPIECCERLGREFTVKRTEKSILEGKNLLFRLNHPNLHHVYY